MSSPTRKTRILFPEPSASDCHAFCSEPCSYYQLCPTSPSPSPPPQVSENPSDFSENPENPESTPVRLHSSSHLVPILPIAASAFAASLLLIFLSILALLHLRRRNRRNRNLPLVENPNFNHQHDVDQDDQVIDHHIWYIRTTGLDQSAIEAITAWEYKAGDGIVGAGVSDCAVCLGEFRDGELLRLLPKCGHAFHVSCIDTWLRSHVNCPLCRAPVVVVSARIGSSRRAANEAPLPLSQPDSSLDVAHSDGNGLRIEIGGEGSEVGNGRDVGSEVVPMHRSASMNSIPFVFSIDGGSDKCEFKDEGDCKDDGSLENGWKGHMRAKSSVFPL